MVEVAVVVGCCLFVFILLSVDNLLMLINWRWLGRDDDRFDAVISFYLYFVTVILYLPCIITLLSVNILLLFPNSTISSLTFIQYILLYVDINYNLTVYYKIAIISLPIIGLIYFKNYSNTIFLLIDCVNFSLFYKKSSIVKLYTDDFYYKYSKS